MSSSFNKVPFRGPRSRKKIFTVYIYTSFFLMSKDESNSGFSCLSDKTYTMHYPLHHGNELFFFLRTRSFKKKTKKHSAFKTFFLYIIVGIGTAWGLQFITSSSRTWYYKLASLNFRIDLRFWSLINLYKCTCKRTRSILFWIEWS